MIAKAGTVLGHDDGEPVTTPYDDCVLVMPAVEPAAARRRHGGSAGSAGLTPACRRIRKRSSDSRTIPSTAPRPP